MIKDSKNKKKHCCHNHHEEDDCVYEYHYDCNDWDKSKKSEDEKEDKKRKHPQVNVYVNFQQSLIGDNKYGTDNDDAEAILGTASVNEDVKQKNTNLTKQDNDGNLLSPMAQNSLPIQANLNDTL